MNNAYLTEDVPPEEPQKDEEVRLRERVERLGQIVEALSNIASSNYWLVLKQFVFDVDLSKARSSLEKEENTTEMFRLQGEIRGRKKFNLEKLLIEKRNELSGIRKKL